MASSDAAPSRTPSALLAASGAAERDDAEAGADQPERSGADVQPAGRYPPDQVRGEDRAERVAGVRQRPRQFDAERGRSEGARQFRLQQLRGRRQDGERRQCEQSDRNRGRIAPGVLISPVVDTRGPPRVSFASERRQCQLVP